MNGECWPASAMSGAAHDINRPLAFLAIPVRLVYLVGDCLIEFFDPICRSVASCFAWGKISVSEASRY